MRNTKHPLSALQGRKCSKTVVSPVCCHNKYTSRLVNTGNVDLVNNSASSRAFTQSLFPIMNASSAYIICNIYTINFPKIRHSNFIKIFFFPRKYCLPLLICERKVYIGVI